MDCELLLQERIVLTVVAAAALPAEASPGHYQPGHCQQLAGCLVVVLVLLLPQLTQFLLHQIETRGEQQLRTDDAGAVVHHVGNLPFQRIVPLSLRLILTVQLLKMRHGLYRTVLSG